MTIHLEPSTLAVCLFEGTVEHLLRLRQNDGETLDSIISRLARNMHGEPDQTPEHTAKRTKAHTKPLSSVPSPPKRTQKYALIFLGEELRAATLGHMFVELIDSLSIVAPEGVEKLATMKSRKRAFVSRSREAIHPGRSDLKTLKTKNGWWVSANIGRRDFNRALGALCKATGLTVSKDVRLLS